MADQNERGSIGPRSQSVFIQSTDPHLGNSTRELRHSHSWAVQHTTDAEIDEDEDGEMSRVNQYHVVESLGSGAFGSVVLVEGVLPGVSHTNSFAIKVCSKSMLKRRRQFHRTDDGRTIISTGLQKVEREIAIMKKLSHPNVVRLYEVIDDAQTDKLCLVMEHIDGGAVMEFDPMTMQYRSPFTNGPLHIEQARAFTWDLINGVNYLHNHGVAHRDIKPDNILLDEDGKARIADFGVAHLFSSLSMDEGRLSNTEGTYSFMAPESLSGSDFSAYTADAWAIGITLFAFVWGEVPFIAERPHDVFTMIRENQVIIPSDADAHLADLLQQLLRKDPQERITLEAALDHPFFDPVRNLRDSILMGIEVEQVSVSDEELGDAITPMSKFVLMSKIKIIMHQRLERLRAERSCQDVTEEPVVDPADVMMTSSEACQQSQSRSRPENPRPGKFARCVIC